MKKIKINLVEDVTKFVKGCTYNFESEIYVKQGRYTISAKSLLGMFSLDLTHPIELEIDTNNEEERTKFDEFVKEWEVQ